MEKYHNRSDVISRPVLLNQPLLQGRTHQLHAGPTRALSLSHMPYAKMGDLPPLLVTWGKGSWAARI